MLEVGSHIKSRVFSPHNSIVGKKYDQSREGAWIYLKSGETGTIIKHYETNVVIVDFDNPEIGKVWVVSNGIELDLNKIRDIKINTINSNDYEQI